MIHYSKRLVPVPPTYERIGAGLGRPFSDLIFAKWGFNNVPARAPARAALRACALATSLGGSGRTLALTYLKELKRTLTGLVLRLQAISSYLRDLARDLDSHNISRDRAEIYQVLRAHLRLTKRVL